MKGIHNFFKSFDSFKFVGTALILAHASLLLSAEFVNAQLLKGIHNATPIHHLALVVGTALILAHASL
ncbi:hypothetical protein JSO54_09440 [Riemerella anatipestifer]|uniref:hypothetical protein n=1 Tax=Riemerella anatipestifer TaxID=34085 RepID=UPI0030C16ED4